MRDPQHSHSGATQPDPVRPSPFVRWGGSWLWAILILLLAYGLRIHNLGVKDFWWDEANSWSLAVLPLIEGLRTGLSVLNDPCTSPC